MRSDKRLMSCQVRSMSENSCRSWNPVANSQQTVRCAQIKCVTISSPIIRMYSQVADLGSACKLAPQSPGLPQTERLSMRVLKLILKLREVSPLVWELYTVSRKGQVTKHK